MFLTAFHTEDVNDLRILNFFVRNCNPTYEQKLIMLICGIRDKFWEMQPSRIIILSISILCSICSYSKWHPFF